MPSEAEKRQPDPTEGGVDQLQLPAELAALADQLAADAQYLAQRYPAPSPEGRLSAGWGRRARRWLYRHRYWVTAVAAAALLLAIGVPALLLSRGRPDQAIVRQAGSRPATGPSQVHQPRSNKSAEEVARLQRSPNPAPVVEQPPAEGSEEPATSPADWMPVDLLQQATAPELEALLDLMQSEDGTTEARLSI